MSQLEYIKPEYVFTSQVSTSNVHPDNSNFIMLTLINRTIEHLDTSEESLSKQDILKIDNSIHVVDTYRDIAEYLENC